MSPPITIEDVLHAVLDLKSAVELQSQRTDARFASTDARIATLERRFERRFEHLEEHMTSIESFMRAGFHRIEVRLERLERSLPH